MTALKTFVAYRHTGVPEDELAALMEAAKAGLDKTGWDWHCTYWQENNFRAQGASRRQIMDHAREQLDQIDFLLCVVDSPIDSPGMAWEMGYCRAHGIPVLTLAREGCSNYGTDMADVVVFYNDDLWSLTLGIIEIAQAGVLEFIQQQVGQQEKPRWSNLSHFNS